MSTNDKQLDLTRPLRCRDENLEVVIYETEVLGPRPIFGRVRRKGQQPEDDWGPMSWSGDGKFFLDGPSDYDLVNVSREGWIIVWPYQTPGPLLGYASDVYPTEEEAHAANADHKGVVNRVEY